MSRSEATPLQSDIQLSGQAGRPATVHGGLFQCLIASPIESRREMLSRAASAAGWETVVCNDAESAAASLAMLVVQMAVVDLDSHGCDELQQLVVGLSATPGMLVLVCGNANAPEEEIAMRQAGAWLYLPAARDGAMVSLLCQDARSIAAKLLESRKLRRPAGRRDPRRSR